MMGGGLGAAFGAAALAVGCAAPLAQLPHHVDLTTPAGAFVVAYGDVDEAAAGQVQSAVNRAGAELLRWGPLTEPVAVEVLPTHAALEEAVDHRGYVWLRAWARYGEVYVQSPRTWGLFGAANADVDELMLHELTHCVMYQAAATRTSWAHKEIPLWFREGMAAVTAHQGYRWPSLELLARFFAAHPGDDPVSSPDPLYRGQSDLVYGAAYHAFQFLDARYGDGAVRDTLRGMKEGASFADAFTAAFGISPDAFTREFRRYVEWGGFRRHAR
jgi:hypothetical protein